MNGTLLSCSKSASGVWPGQPSALAVCLCGSLGSLYYAAGHAPHHSATERDRIRDCGWRSLSCLTQTHTHTHAATSSGLFHGCSHSYTSGVSLTASTTSTQEDHALTPASKITRLHFHADYIHNTQAREEFITENAHF